VTFIVAYMLVNGVSVAVGSTMAQGKSFSEASSWTTQMQLAAMGAAIQIVGFTIIYGISRALTRMIPLKAGPWILGSVLVGNLLAMGQIYGVVSDAFGIEEARSVALRAGVIGAMGGMMAWAAFCAIFRNQS
jgi:hypothetical protein